MHLKHKDIIDRPREEVYNLVKKELEKIAPFFPNVEKVEVKSMEENTEKEETYIINHWFAKAEIPAIAEKFVKKELFSWKDSATWKDKEFIVEYELESFWANDLFDAKGINSFKEIDGKTELTVSCDVEIHPNKVPGVPKFLVKKVLPIIEEMLKGVLAPNLKGLGQGLKGYYESKS